MATDNPFKNLGLEYMNWRNAPSIGPLLGLFLADSGKEEQNQNQPALGQGIAAPTVPGGLGVSPTKPSGIGIAPGQFQMPSLTLPQIGAAPMAQSGVDLDGDGQVDNFWKVKKLGSAQ